MKRLWLYGGLLCLPLAVTVGAAAWFLVDRVPEFAKNEHRRVVAGYRAVARDLQRMPGGTARRRERAWKPTGKMAPGKWGFLPDPDDSARTLVWYEDSAGSAVESVETEQEFDFKSFFPAAAVLFLTALALVTVLGLRFFIGYVKGRDDFMAATAHDLMTPLAGMRYAIGRDDGDAKALNERLIRIVENIRDFLRLGGRRKPVPAAVDLVAAFREAYALFRADFRDLYDGDDVEVRGDGAPVMALADATMTVQILWNLLGNDLKYAAPHGRVSVRFAAEGGRAAVAVADEGPGMTARQRARVFDRYYRARTAMASGKGGFGIGLCTAREFARAMGGDLTVAAHGKGSVFTLTLPAAI